MRISTPAAAYKFIDSVAGGADMNNEIGRKNTHNAIIEGRERIMLSGVEDVVSFDELELELVTALGELTVRGEMLNIESLNRETGDMVVTGKINEFIYSDRKPEAKGFLKKLFS